MVSDWYNIYGNFSGSAINCRGLYLLLYVHIMPLTVLGPLSGQVNSIRMVINSHLGNQPPPVARPKVNAKQDQTSPTEIYMINVSLPSPNPTPIRSPHSKD